MDLDEDLFGQLTEDLSVSLSVNGSFAARSEVRSPEAFARTVDKVARALPQFGSGLGVTDVRRRGDLYEARLANGGRFFFGMRNDAFVAASDAARTPQSSVSGAELGRRGRRLACHGG